MLVDLLQINFSHPPALLLYKISVGSDGVVVGNLDILRCMVIFACCDGVFVPFVIASKVSVPQLKVVHSLQ